MSSTKPQHRVSYTGIGLVLGCALGIVVGSLARTTTPLLGVVIGSAADLLVGVRGLAKCRADAVVRQACG
jgi:uncharacterized membrane protein